MDRGDHRSRFTGFFALSSSSVQKYLLLQNTSVNSDFFICKDDRNFQSQPESIGQHKQSNKKIKTTRHKSIL